MNNATVALVIFISLHTLAAAEPLAASFTYQGELQASGSPANGNYDFQFELFDAATLGAAIASPIIVDNVTVSDGIFSVELDFGSSPFAGDQLWMEIGVRDGASSGGFTGLLPLQKLTAAPYALHAEMVALNAITSAEIANNTVVAADLAANSVGASEIASNAVRAAELADGSVDAAAIVLPVTLVANVVASLNPLSSATVTVINTSPTLGADGSSPYAVVGRSDYSSGTNSPLSLPPAGVYGQTDAPNGTGVGVLGLSGDKSGLGFTFKAGVLGLSDTSYGVWGGSNGTTAGVRGDSANSYGGDFRGQQGLRALGEGTSAQQGYGARITSNGYRGMYAQGASGWFDAYFGGTGGISTFGIVDRSPAALRLVINLGDSDIEAGDLVALAGVGSSPENGEPMLGVAKLDASNSHAVIGVAAKAYVMTSVVDDENSEQVDFLPKANGAEPAEFLTIVTNGLAPAVKLTSIAKVGNLAIGDRVSLTTEGYMQKAFRNTDDTVIGKVAGPVDAANGTLPLFIDID